MITRRHAFVAFLIFGILLSLYVSNAAKSLGCKLAPRHWCDTEENARKCEVYDMCKKYMWDGKMNSPHRPVVLNDSQAVNLTLYYESLCPDCKDFMIQELYPVMQEVGEITNLVLIPYGNAHQKKVSTGWVFECQHGPEECLGNIIQTCAIHFYPDVKQQLFFIHCMEVSSERPEVSAPKCAKMSGIDYNMVKMCTNSSLGNRLEHKMADLTDALQPPHTYVPWITLNCNGFYQSLRNVFIRYDTLTVICHIVFDAHFPNQTAPEMRNLLLPSSSSVISQIKNGLIFSKKVHTDAIQKKAETNLLKLLCGAYKGTKKPAACKTKKLPEIKYL